MSASAMRRTIYDDVHKEFRESVRTFLEREAVPHADDWEQKGMVDRSFWRKAGAAGFVGFEAPEEYGGIGVSDFRFNAIIDEEVEYLGVVSRQFRAGERHRRAIPDRAGQRGAAAPLVAAASPPASSSSRSR